jgi:septation ring formation regulator EzrA
MKIILTLLIFIVAFYLAAMMFRRLTQTMQQLADLRSDLAKSDVQLRRDLRRFKLTRNPETRNFEYSK